MAAETEPTTPTTEPTFNGDILYLYLNEAQSQEGTKDYSLSSDIYYFRRMEKARVAFHLLSLVDPSSITEDLSEHWGGVNILSNHPEKTKTFVEKFQQYPVEKRETLKDSLRKTMMQCKNIYDEYFAKNLRLVFSIAYKHKKSNIDLKDLIQEGNQGLVRAMHGYDWRRGIMFSTYAYRAIQQAVTRAIKSDGRKINLPSNKIDLIHSVRNNISRLQNTLGREPDMREIANAMYLSEEELAILFRSDLEILSLNKKLPEGKKELYEVLSATDEDAQTEVEAIQNIITEDLKRILRSILTPRESIIIWFNLVVGHDMVEIGRMLNLTRERIRQIRNVALDKLRSEPHMKAYMSADTD